jgi:hypothetical protein
MVHAPESRSTIALSLAGKHSSPVGAAIVKGMELHVFVAAKDDRLPTQGGRHIIAGFRKLALVGHELPGAAKYLLHFDLVNLWVGIDPAIDDLGHIQP